ncbi:MAG TPA: hypothetical protein VGQ76_22435 [Thermoanaerobaculia bacterium]|jgi:hypothetical protein|nr:hypothetical protein [Thermoanaerobaculia bacterium]
MKPTRREFMIMTTAAMCTLSVSDGWSAAQLHHALEPALFDGDPYTAHVDDHGLGGRTWESAYEHAIRFRSNAADRDRYVLGLEI